MNATNLDEKLAAFSEHWQPRTIGQFNGHDLMVVKVKGEFVWHKHDDTDDSFSSEGAPDDPVARPDVTLGPGEIVRRAEGCRALSLCGGGNPPAADRADGHSEHGQCGDSGAASRRIRFDATCDSPTATASMTSGGWQCGVCLAPFSITSMGRPMMK